MFIPYNKTIDSRGGFINKNYVKYIQTEVECIDEAIDGKVGLYKLRVIGYDDAGHYLLFKEEQFMGDCDDAERKAQEMCHILVKTIYAAEAKKN